MPLHWVGTKRSKVRRKNIDWEGKLKEKNKKSIREGQKSSQDSRETKVVRDENTKK